MKFLLVEDESPKLDELKAFFSSVYPAELKAARSVRSAIDFIRSGEHVDAMILDMSLPTFDIVDGESGGIPKPFGGIEIMRFLKKIDLLIPTVVLTGYPSFEGDGGIVTLQSLQNSMKIEFGTILIDVIQYSVASDNWSLQLLGVLTKNIEKNDKYFNRR